MESKLLIQTEDYNCGVFALEYLLRLKGIKLPLDVIEVGCKTDEENGTSHNNLMQFLRISGIEFTHSYNSTITHLFNHCPCLVNYQYEDDGHYGVVVSHGKVYLNIYNPATGKIEDLRFDEFESDWHSKRYGNRFLLFLKDGTTN